MTVKWTNRALRDLRRIFEYYRDHASEAVARRITTHIVTRSLELERYPQLGQLELLLEGKSVEYRFLLAGNQKLIYWIESDAVFVATLFDCRQDPLKLLKRLE